MWYHVSLNNYLFIYLLLTNTAITEDAILHTILDNSFRSPGLRLSLLSYSSSRRHIFPVPLQRTRSCSRLQTDEQEDDLASKFWSNTAHSLAYPSLWLLPQPSTISPAQHKHWFQLLGNSMATVLLDHCHHHCSWLTFCLFAMTTKSHSHKKPCINSSRVLTLLNALAQQCLPIQTTGKAWNA